MDIISCEPAPLQANNIKPHEIRLGPKSKSEWNDVPGNPANPTQHRALADADELMQRGIAPNKNMVGDRDMPAKERTVGESNIVAYMTIVPNVRVGHQEAAVTDRGHSPAILGAGVDRYTFANATIASNSQPGIAPAITG